jgi:DNA-binding Lrp family transcriptional regulator
VVSNIDDLDLKILNLLLSNGKLSYRKLAQRLGVSTATIMARVNRLEKTGAVRKYSAVLDYEKLGYDVSVIIDVRVSKGKLFEVEKRIATHPNVRAVFDVTGAFDTLILANFKSRKDLDHFLKKIQTYDFVERTETKLILNRVKDEHIKVS